MEKHKHIDFAKSEDWICTDENCRNVNFSKRTHCNRCNRVRPKSAVKKNPKQVLFKSNDWKCDDCGNINWAKREKCNICSKSRYTKKVNEFKTNKEIRTGKGGGHYDIQGNNEKRVHDSDDEEYDEFGRKKKRKIAGNDEKGLKENLESRNNSANKDSHYRSDPYRSDPDRSDRDRSDPYRTDLHKNKSFEGSRSRSFPRDDYKNNHAHGEDKGFRKNYAGGDSRKYYEKKYNSDGKPMDRNSNYEDRFNERIYDNSNRYNDGGYDSGHDGGRYGGKHGEDNFNGGRFDRGRFDRGRYDRGRYDRGRYDRGRYDRGRYDRGRYDRGRYDRGRHDGGRHDGGRFNDRRNDIERRNYENE
ncbi:zinc finger, RAN binding protein, putative [Plasmodium ovale]|uniref:Zinc finger, RAN binding protein, putative n=1 Tax=Plasmodium ovale TaxID=36330 RepID=A0A1C3KNB0_PLAOA|nr:zinc finger, RAN binding protein, putative [Plasmodium ovale]